MKHILFSLFLIALLPISFVYGNFQSLSQASDGIVEKYLELEKQIDKVEITTTKAKEEFELFYDLYLKDFKDDGINYKFNIYLEKLNNIDMILFSLSRIYNKIISDINSKKNGKEMVYIDQLSNYIDIMGIICKEDYFQTKKVWSNIDGKQGLIYLTGTLYEDWLKKLDEEYDYLGLFSKINIKDIGGDIECDFAHVYGNNSLLTDEQQLDSNNESIDNNTGTQQTNTLKPDLSVKEFDYSSKNNQLNIVLVNTGTAQIDGMIGIKVFVDLNDDGKEDTGETYLFYSSRIVLINESVDIKFDMNNIKILNDKKYNVKISIDPEELISELNRNNNSKIERLDLVTTKDSFKEDNRSDLKVKELTYNENNEELVLVIENLGKKLTTEFAFQIIIGDQTNDYHINQAINESGTYSFKIDLNDFIIDETQTYKIKIKLDINNNVNEQKKGNNSFDKEIKIYQIKKATQEKLILISLYEEYLMFKQLQEQYQKLLINHKNFSNVLNYYYKKYIADIDRIVDSFNISNKEKYISSLILSRGTSYYVEKKIFDLLDQLNQDGKFNKAKSQLDKIISLSMRMSTKSSTYNTMYVKYEKIISSYESFLKEIVSKSDKIVYLYKTGDYDCKKVYDQYKSMIDYFYSQYKFFKPSVDNFINSQYQLLVNQGCDIKKLIDDIELQAINQKKIDKENDLIIQKEQIWKDKKIEKVKKFFELININFEKKSYTYEYKLKQYQSLSKILNSIRNSLSNKQKESNQGWLIKYISQELSNEVNNLKNSENISKSDNDSLSGANYDGGLLILEIKYFEKPNLRLKRNQVEGIDILGITLMCEGKEDNYLGKIYSSVQYYDLELEDGDNCKYLVNGYDKNLNYSINSDKITTEIIPLNDNVNISE